MIERAIGRGDQDLAPDPDRITQQLERRFQQRTRTYVGFVLDDEDLAELEDEEIDTFERFRVKKRGRR